MSRLLLGGRGSQLHVGADRERRSQSLRGFLGHSRVLLAEGCLRMTLWWPDGARTPSDSSDSKELAASRHQP